MTNSNISTNSEIPTPVATETKVITMTVAEQIEANKVRIAKELEDKVAEARLGRQMRIHNNRLKSDYAIDYALSKESITTVTEHVRNIADMLELDEERLETALSNIRRSEYGKVPELLTTIAKVYAWPINDGDDRTTIAEKQEAILEYFEEQGMNVTEDLLLDIKEAKGFHTYLTRDTFEVMDGVEPDFEAFKFHTAMLAEIMDLPFIDHKLDEQKWFRAENKAIIKVNAQIEAGMEAKKAHDALEEA